ncbi:MAG: GTP 3',8-cyclase MoaA [Planctomycetes bacterium]|nr:GTP 3',8-cyclase MoaA [Planctomycetota bacterium]
MPLQDTQGRPLKNLRLSVTDRCNLRCLYCMPEEHYTWLPREDVLSFREISDLVDVFCDLGVDKVRITGGEPLVRRDLPVLVEELARKRRIRDLALTTNGVLLADAAADLKRAGLLRVTVSLDTLRPERFLALARQDALARVLLGIEALGRAGFTRTRIDSVLLRGMNDDEILDLLDFGREAGAEVRFIEYMDVGGATRWSAGAVVAQGEILRRIEEARGPAQALPASPGEESAPAKRFRLADGTVFGVIASTTTPFCATCDRSRLTADGTWYLCLYARQGVDLKTPLRQNASREQLARVIAAGWEKRADRGAEERLALRERAPPLPRQALEGDPRLEMHTRGG